MKESKGKNRDVGKALGKYGKNSKETRMARHHAGVILSRSWTVREILSF